MLPVGTFGCPGVSLPGAVSASCAPTSSSMKVACASIQASVVQQQATAVVQKRNQMVQIKATDVNNTLLLKPKIQEDLIIARDIVINDADPAMRYKLTKRQTQEEIQKCTGAVVITRGKYRPPNAVPDGEKPLYLHISAGAQLTETVERILAVDRAASIVEDMLKQISQPLNACIYLGFDADPSLKIASRIHGPNNQYINHIKNETGTTVVLRGHGSGYLGNTQGEEGHQPLHLLLSSNNQKSLEDAKLLAENLLDTISQEFGANRVSSSKVYNAVPPPQQLLVGIQSSGIDLHSNLSSAESITCSGATLMPGPPLPSVVVPVVPTAVSCGQVMQPGASLSLDHALTNDFPYSQPHLTACKSYSAYAGIYPQAIPLQQVTLGRRQSGPVSSTVSPAAAASKVMPKSSSDSEKRKRKFQESPAAFKGVAASQQVEVAKPFEKSKKRAHEVSSRAVSQSKVLKADSGFTSSGGLVLKVQEIDMKCLRSLMEIPEPAARSVLDQFLLSGGDEIDKGAFLAGLVTKYQVRTLGTNRMPQHTSRANEFNVRSDLPRLLSRSQLSIVDAFSSHVSTSMPSEVLGVRSDLLRLPSRSEVPVIDSFSSRMATSRYERYSPCLSYLDYSLSPQAGSSRTLGEGKLPQAHLLGSSPSFERMGMRSPIIAAASRQATQPRVKFDPFTGEPYKFDPYTGEPIQPESLSCGSHSLY